MVEGQKQRDTVDPDSVLRTLLAQWDQAKQEQDEAEQVFKAKEALTKQIAELVKDLTVQKYPNSDVLTFTGDVPCKVSQIVGTKLDTKMVKSLHPGVAAECSTPFAYVEIRRVK